jgi:2-polyprenyl-3-methyl-5-hydroxy-6-metoxy-1,4-benzoquinol methylase
MAESFDPQNKAEFDRWADGYDRIHAKNVALSGEDPEYFAVYKHRVLKEILGPRFGEPVLDFGCGIGNLTRHLVRSFPKVDGYDPSAESVSLARQRAPEARFFDDVDALPKEHYGAVVLANVLHHVPPENRPGLLRIVTQRLARRGKVIVFEHNPLNPVTRKVVADCPFDENAVLLYPREVKRLLRDAKLAKVELDYIVFFPRALAWLRPMERRLRWLPAGAQVVAWGERR